MNTDKLPKVADIVDVIPIDFEDKLIFTFKEATAIAHEYTRQVLDVVAENATIKHNDESIQMSEEQIDKLKQTFASWKEEWSHPSMNIYDYEVDKSSILSFKDKLK